MFHPAIEGVCTHTATFLCSCSKKYAICLLFANLALFPASLHCEERKQTTSCIHSLDCRHQFILPATQV